MEALHPNTVLLQVVRWWRLGDWEQRRTPAHLKSEERQPGPGCMREEEKS